MTEEDVIKIAREAGLINCDCCFPFWPEDDQTNWQIFFKRFATIIAAAERNAWIKKLTRSDCKQSNIFRSYYPSANGDWVDLRELKKVINETTEEEIIDKNSL